MGLKVLRPEDLDSKKICLVVGTRPGIIMFSPIIRESMRRELDFFVIHTGQHYSYEMDKIIFDTLNLPKPAHHLKDVAEKKYHGAQTAAMLQGIERTLMKERPALVIVGGDANTNLAGALAARKLHINVGHIEAGERSYDWRMPEEHNRRMIDHIADLLFATNKKSANRLRDEKVIGDVFVTGNTIVDAALQNIDIARRTSRIIEENGLEYKNYIVLTTHREENVDFVENLAGIIKGIKSLSEASGLNIFFAAHPRTLNRLKHFGMMAMAKGHAGVILKSAPGYLDFLHLLASARLVLTDSGGVQQEACIFKVPCVTLRENTEWIETLEIRANILAGTDPPRIVTAALEMLERKVDWEIPFGDGRASELILDICEQFLEGQGTEHSS
jgi:UDP-N-acetylglucosamine 2-epimerase (non-hydrolysing)